jgi:hypothetical protein
VLKLFSYFKWQVIEAGANAIVAGSAVFGAPDYAEGMVSSQCHSCSKFEIPYRFQIKYTMSAATKVFIIIIDDPLAILQLSKESRPAKDLQLYTHKGLDV